MEREERETGGGDKGKESWDEIGKKGGKAWNLAWCCGLGVMGV